MPLAPRRERSRPSIGRSRRRPPPPANPPRRPRRRSGPGEPAGRPRGLRSAGAPAEPGGFLGFRLADAAGTQGWRAVRLALAAAGQARRHPPRAPQGGGRVLSALRAADARAVRVRQGRASGVGGSARSPPADARGHAALRRIPGDGGARARRGVSGAHGGFGDAVPREKRTAASSRPSGNAPAAATTPVDCEKAVESDAYRIRRVLAHWVEEGSLKIRGQGASA